MVASIIVLMLFTFSSTIIPNKDIELVKVSINTSENNNENLLNNVK